MIKSKTKKNNKKKSISASKNDHIEIIKVEVDTKLVDSKPVEESKLESESKPIEETKVKEESKSTEETKVEEEYKPVEETKIEAESKPIEESKVVEEVKVVEQSKVVEETKIGEEYKVVEETKIGEESKVIEESKQVIKINTLCFSGGGVKGFSFIGALEKIIEKKLIELNDITLFVGTSAGSILSFLLILGWTIKELKDFIINFNFSKLIGEIDCINFFENFGFEDGERINLLFIKFLESKYDKKDITFQELFDFTNKKLIMIGTNLTLGKEAIFSVDTTPNLSVLLALRISCSIPIILNPVKYNDELYSDGGLVNNFPINHCPIKSTIGFYVKNSSNNVIDSVKALISATLRSVADTISEKNIKKYSKCIIQINNVNIEIANFDIDLEKKLKLIELGYNEATRVIDNSVFLS